MIYVLYFADVGTPKTSLSPTIDIFVKVSDGSSAGTPPTVAELSGGFYKFTYTSTEDVSIRVDSNDANMSDADRYISFVASPHDTSLEDIKGTGFVKDTDSLVDIRPETDKISTVKTETDKIPSIKTETDKIPTLLTESQSHPTLTEIEATTVLAKDATVAKEATVATLQLDVTKLVKVEEGRWRIVNNQLIIYDSDGVTPLYTFDLFDKDGNPTQKDVTERVPV